eukprot:TRINITY_DN9300_c0_g1_i1.p1 TRINITY_DN9300_c0_g1~~TRINITY_DN9300_c0_g1_i1.p1  ORF type:complete len:492 (-),score=90.51 TRINITY_DN9300_c0_g1_i1:97-1572(-)
MFVVFLLCLICFLSWRLLRKSSSWRGEVPPGPPMHPIFGNIPTMSKLDPRPQFAFHSIAMEFGNLVRLKMGPKFMLLVSGFEEMKELHGNEITENRANLQTANLIYRGKFQSKGILFNYGEEFKELRRFTLKSLRDLGFGKNSSEEIILEECREVVGKIKELVEEKDGIVNLDKLFNKAALNIVWHLTAGERFDYEDEKMHKLHCFLESFMLIGKDIMGKPLGIFPFLRFFPPFRSVFNECSEGMKQLREFISKSISEHESSLDTSNPRDYIDIFLINGKENPTLSKENLVTCCMDLFVAGSETTSKSLMFALALMVRHPEVEEKVRKEIRSVTGEREFVRVEDKEKLPFTEATLNEVWRIANVVPLTPPRITTDVLKIGKYEIPESTMIMSNTYTVHMDEKYWGDPYNFRPERFLQNETFKPDERNIPFGIGRRRCLGENLARMENFLIFSNLLKNFSFETANGELPDLSPQVGFTNGPPPFEMLIKTLD